MSTEFENELKHFLVEALLLEDVMPDQIDAEAPLFVEGLGLDSIDALELATAIHRRYGVKVGSDDAKNRQIFSSLRALAAYIESERTSAERTKAAS